MRIRHILLLILIIGLASNVFAIKPEPVCDDGDGDGYFVSKKCIPTGDCDDSDVTVHPGVDEICDGIDNNCDGEIDEGCPAPPPEPTRCDRDADGYAANTKQCNWGDDCNDRNAAVNPGATEICDDGIDNDCNGDIDAIDEYCNQGLQTYYFDADEDGFGDVTQGTEAVSRPVGYVENGTDCDDTRASVYPGATELCDGLDNDCDGTVDDGCLSTYPFSMAAAGDSITVAYNADDAQNILGGTDEQYELSWALGDSLEVNSHAQRLWALEDGFSWDARLDNYAVAGANIADLQDQITEIVSNGPYDYVVIFIGHNDICDASIPEEMLKAKPDDPDVPDEEEEPTFQGLFIAAMEVLYAQAPPPAVVVSSLANVSNLYNVGKDDNWCNGDAFFGRSIWEWGNICRVVTAGDLSNIAAADLRTQEFNAVLEENSSVYGYRYVPEIYETEFTLDDLSDFDCFHPNVAGQNKIAEIIWNNGLYNE